jgi:copper chaperone CopZ
MSSNMITTTLYINNMTCVNCENTIERLLTSKAGIKCVNASYSSGTVVITYNPNEIALEHIELMIE